MESVVLVIHLILALSIIALILLQRSEGGGLGMGSSGGLGAFASAQTTGNALTRLTAICAGLFFATSLILGILAGSHHKQRSIMDNLDKPVPAAEASATAGTPSAPADTGTADTTKSDMESTAPATQKTAPKAKKRKPAAEAPAAQEAPSAPVSE